MSQLRRRVVLINNYYRNIFPRGIIAYVNDIEQYLESSNIPCRTLCCPKFMESWRKQGIWFHLFEQFYVPLVGLRYKVVIYPYNSAAILSAFHPGSLLVVHDFIAYKKRVAGYSAASAKLVRWTQCVYQFSHRNVAYITRDVARQARYIRKFPKSTPYILPNTFFCFQRRATEIEVSREKKEEFILLCTGKVPTKDLDGALRLYRNSAAACRHRVRILGLAGASNLVDEVVEPRSELRRLITVLPIVSSARLIELYKSAMVVWVHSTREGFGRNVAEALICHAKVIASDISPFRKQAARSHNVYLYRNGNQTSFDAALTQVLSRPTVDEEYALNAKDLAETFQELLAR
jgi:glycosyltransferase involved in cell wall biosynthesis